VYIRFILLFAFDLQLTLWLVNGVRLTDPDPVHANYLSVVKVTEN